jgi:hypothetical protein
VIRRRGQAAARPDYERIAELEHLCGFAQPGQHPVTVRCETCDVERLVQQKLLDLAEAQARQERVAAEVEAAKASGRPHHLIVQFGSRAPVRVLYTDGSSVSPVRSLAVTRRAAASAAPTAAASPATSATTTPRT